MRRSLFQILVMIAAFNFLSAIAFGQNQWTRQSPLPAARNLTGAAWATPTHGFASGEYGTFIETFDGGATWRTVNLDIFPSDPFYNVYCRDADNCFVIGNSSTNGPDHWRTTDGGTTWQRITNFPLGGSWYHIDFVSASVGFMGSNGAVVRTIDGGATWALMSDYLTCPVIYGMDFRDAQVGLAGGNRVSTTDGGPGIFKTTDAGVTWVRKFPQSANDVLWLSDTTAIAIVGGSIYRSTDAGETWSEISNRISTGFDEMTLLPNGTIVGVSLAGDAWRSADGGFNWTRTLVGLGALPASWNVSFFDNQLGAIVGQGGFIFKTTDGGLTWAMLNNGIGGVSFYDLEMFDDGAGLAVGDNGYILRTANGGNRWDTSRVQVTGVVLFRDESLQAVSVVDESFAVAAGYDGVVYKTFDRGATWQSIGYPNLPGDVYLSDVKFINRNLGYVTGSRPSVAQNLWRTTDGGASWELINLNLGHSIDFIDANRGWVMNVGGLGYRTTDGGATWQQMILPNQGFSPTISKIDFINENEGWAVGWYGYAAHTIDGGRTWQLQNIATQEEHILGLHVLSQTEAFAVGIHAAPSNETASLYHTNDAGATWTKYLLPNEYSLSSVFASASRKIWTSGYDGAVLHNPNFTAPAPALLLTFNPTRVIGGNSSQGTIRLNNPAPAGGRTIRLSSGSSLVSVPSSVSVPAGATSATFTTTTQAVNPNNPSPRVSVTASYNGNSDTADLVLAPPFVCSFAISPSSEYFGATGGQVVVHVTATAGCNWTATSNRSWITFPNGNSGTGNGRVTLAVSPNTGSLTAFGTATIAGQTFGIQQASSSSCVFSLSSSAQTFDASGGSGSLAVSVTGNCFNGWITRSNENWITVTPANGQGNGTVNYAVARNDTTASRTGTLTVSGQVFTITQNSLASTPNPTPTPIPSPLPSQIIYGITLAGEPPGSPNNLVAFNADSPGTLTLNTRISGLQSNEQLVVIDFRPATGELYGVSNQSRIYRINVQTAAAAVVNLTPFSPALPSFGVSFGSDFNPVTDRLRVVSSQGLNIQLDPNTGMVAQIDTNLMYAAGDPNSGQSPMIVGLAYSDNTAGATTTTAYAVDSTLDILARLGSPNGTPVSPSSGQLITIGNLGVDTFEAVGFDIASSGTAYASLSVPGGGSSFKLYTINLGTGTATLGGEIGVFTVADIAVPTDGVAPTPIVSGRVTYANALTTTGVPFTTITAAGSIPLSTMTNSNGDYSLSGFGAGAYTITPSKANQVNGISNLDASTVAQHVAGLIKLNDPQLVAADTSGNGSISSLDAAYIAQFVASIPNPSITGTWKFIPANRSYPNVMTNQTNQNYSAILVGEVTGNWNPAGPLRFDLLNWNPTEALRFDLSKVDGEQTKQAEKAAQEIVAVTARTNQVGEEKIAMMVDLTAAETTGEGILGYQFDLLYDKQVVEPQAVSCDVSETISRGTTAICRVSEPGVMKVVVFGATPISGTGTLLKLKFNVIRATGSTLPLRIENFMFNEDMPTAVTVSGR